MNQIQHMAGRRARAAAMLVAGLVILYGSVLPDPAAAASSAGGPVQAAAGGAIVSVSDPDDYYEPKGDIRQIGVGDGGDGSLVFSTQVAEYSDPFTDPSWANQDTAAEWLLDTSGEGLSGVIVGVYIVGTELRAGVFDIYTRGLVCRGAPTADAASRTYSAKVGPGCLGEVKSLSMTAVFHYENHRRIYDRDTAPNDGAVRFGLPAAGPATAGYALVSRGAGFQRFGAVPPGAATPAGTFEDYGGTSPVVAVASARRFDPGLWSVTEDGEVLTQDGAEFYGDARDIPLAEPIVGMAVLPDRSGYWLVAKDGGVFSFGRALFLGSTGGTKLDKPVVGIAPAPSGFGYWLVASDGGIFNYGDAKFYGSTGNIALNKPVVGMTRAPASDAGGLSSPPSGYWLVASDGGIFAFNAPFYGSTGAMRLAQPIVGMAATRGGSGYRFIARDGGVFSFGDAEFHGSGATPGRSDVIGIATA